MKSLYFDIFTNEGKEIVTIFVLFNGKQYILLNDNKFFLFDLKYQSFAHYFSYYESNPILVVKNELHLIRLFVLIVFSCDPDVLVSYDNINKGVTYI